MGFKNSKRFVKSENKSTFESYFFRVSQIFFRPKARPVSGLYKFWIQYVETAYPIKLAILIFFQSIDRW